jgi:hypothetical protein
MDEITPATTVTIPIMLIWLLVKLRGTKSEDNIEPYAIKLPITNAKEIKRRTKFLSLTAARKAGRNFFSFGYCIAAKLGG